MQTNIDHIAGILEDNEHTRSRGDRDHHFNQYYQDTETGLEDLVVLMSLLREAESIANNENNADSTLSNFYFYFLITSGHQPSLYFFLIYLVIYLCIVLILFFIFAYVIFLIEVWK